MREVSADFARHSISFDARGKCVDQGVSGEAVAGFGAWVVSPLEHLLEGELGMVTFEMRA